MNAPKIVIRLLKILSRVMRSLNTSVKPLGTMPLTFDLTSGHFRGQGLPPTPLELIS